MRTLALFQGLGHWELLIILAIGLLLFGRRLPEVGRSLGRSIVEFRRGLRGIEHELEEESRPSQLDSGVARPPMDALGRDPRVSRGEASGTATGPTAEPPHPNM